MSRPSLYTPELAAKICERLAAGESLRQICRDEDMPNASTVHRWVEADEGFCKQYAQARDAGLDHMADEMLQIADDGTSDFVDAGLGTNKDGTPIGKVFDSEHVQRSKLRVDTRKWYLSKLAPKRYGDKLTTEISGPNGGPIKLDDATRAARIDAIYAAAAQRRDNADDLA